MPASRAAAEDPQPLPMGMSLSIFNDLAISIEDEMMFDPTGKFAADLSVASSSGDGKIFRGASLDLDVESQSQSRRIEGRPEIGRGPGQR